MPELSSLMRHGLVAASHKSKGPQTKTKPDIRPVSPLPSERCRRVPLGMWSKELLSGICADIAFARLLVDHLIDVSLSRVCIIERFDLRLALTADATVPNRDIGSAAGDFPEFRGCPADEFKVLSGRGTR